MDTFARWQHSLIDRNDDNLNSCCIRHDASVALYIGENDFPACQVGCSIFENFHNGIRTCYTVSHWPVDTKISATRRPNFGAHFETRFDDFDSIYHRLCHHYEFLHFPIVFVASKIKKKNFSIDMTR